MDWRAHQWLWVAFVAVAVTLLLHCFGLRCERLTVPWGVGMDMRQVRRMQAVVDSGAGDTCPFPRPFQSGFSDCSMFAPFATRDQRIGAIRASKLVITCRHLLPGSIEVGRFYGRCLLGGPQAIGPAETTSQTA